MAEHASLIVLAAVLSLGILLSFIYVRCVLRFVLIDAVIRRQVAVGEAWKSLESQGRAYFGWLLAVVGVVLVGVCAAVLTTLRYLNVIRDAGYPEWLTSLLLAMELLTVVSVGLLLTITIMLTDDLVAPLVYAERISLPAAWRVFWVMARRDSGSFSIYLLFRLAVGMGISIAVLIVLFPVLMGLSSGALVIAALVILALRAVGLVWIWNPVTMILGAAALSLFTALLFALLSVIGMPGQIYLQNYGVRFMASRVPSLGVLCRDPPAQGRDR